jgi:dipeptidase
MHAGRGPVRVGQTTGSLVSHLTASHQTHWVTATAAPCTSIFKPVWIDAGLPDTGDVPTGRYSRASLWWRHEALHRSVLRDYTVRLPVYLAGRDEMEARFLATAADYREQPVEARQEFSARCFWEAERATAHWTEQVTNTPAENKLPRGYGRQWENFNKAAGYYTPYRSDFANGPSG